MTNGELAGKVAVVTGGGRGIGRATALRLAGAGASVTLAARTPSEIEAVADEARALGVEALAVSTDVTNEAQVQAMARAVVERFGRVDILINNAGGGGGYRGPILGLSVEEWDGVFALNCRSTFLCVRELAPHMIEGGGGVIVNVASETGRRATPGLAHYGASKFALWGFTQSLATELGPQNVRVNAVQPGAILTTALEGYFERVAVQEGITVKAARQRMSAKSPMNRLIEAEEIANVIYFLSTDASKSLVGVCVDANAGALMR